MLSNDPKVKRNLRVLGLLYGIFVLSQQSAEAATFDGCDHIYHINAGASYLESPNYPYTYPPGTACRYKFIAPLDHDITVNCNINLAKGAQSCNSEIFYIARDGDIYLRDSEATCGKGTLVRTSLFNTLVVAYISKGSYGSFRCQLQVKPQPCSCGWSMKPKIANGQETTVNEYPSIAALKDLATNQPSYCGATIISHRYLLSAAHCIRIQPNPSQIAALIGRHNLRSVPDTRYAATYYISRVIEHPNYSPNPVNNDIALLLTTTNIEYSRGVGPICLPPPSNVNNKFEHENVDIIGWGTTSFAGPSSPNLLKATLTVLKNQVCSKTFPSLSATQMCTYDSQGTHKDSCQFDSGGPVILQTKHQFLVGIISYGKECGVSNYGIGINSRITSYLSWIYQTIGSSTCNVSL